MSGDGFVARGFLSLCGKLDQATLAICRLLLVVLLLANIAIVVLRYCFGIGFVELQDFAAYNFAALVALGLPIGLVRDAHVRVDILREKMAVPVRRRIDILGILLFLVPVFALTIYVGFPEIRYAWQIRESSIETGGLPGLFIVKTALPVACALMILQGLAIVVRGGRVNRQK